MINNKLNFGNFYPLMENHFPLCSLDQEIIDKFHSLYFRLNEKKPGLMLSWMGYQVGKLPGDLWLYQELLFKLKPDVIIECGTHRGGSALFFANILQLLGNGRVLTVDLYPKENLPSHALITYFNGSSTDLNVFQNISKSINENEKVLIILDSNHTRDHVLEEMCLYKNLVSSGSYLVIEDTFLNGHPSHENYGPGPMEAIDDFLLINSDFEVDRSLEKFLFTLNRRGFLRRIK